MDDKIIEEMKNILKEMNIDYDEFIKDSIPSEKKNKLNEKKKKAKTPFSIINSHLKKNNEKNINFFMSFKIEFQNTASPHLIMKNIKINQKSGSMSNLFLPKAEEFFENYSKSEIFFGRHLIYRPEDKFDHYSVQFLKILKNIIDFNIWEYAGKRDIKLPYFLLETLLPLFPHLCLNYIKPEIFPEITLEEKEDNIIIDVSKLKNWYFLDENFMIFCDEEQDIKILRTDYNVEGIFLLKNIAKDNMIIFPADKININSFVKHYEKIIKINGSENLQKNIYTPKEIKAGIFFDISSDNIFIALIEPLFDGKRKNDIKTEMAENKFQVRRVVSEADKALLKHGFVYDIKLNRYYLFFENMVYNFVKNCLQPVSEEFSNFYIFYTEEFKKRKYFETSLSVKIEQKDDFTFSFEAPELSSEEIGEIVASKRINKEYFKLKNGNIVKVNQKDLEKVNDFMQKISAERDEIKTGKIVRKNYFDFFINNYNLTEKSCKDYFGYVPEFNSLVREYQKYGVNWMLTLKEKNMGGILADDMGLGKTIQALIFLTIEKILFPEKPSLIVMPKSIIYNWENEINKNFPNMKYRIIVGSRSRQKEILNISPGEVVLTTYNLVVRDIELYEKIEFETLILDEAQNIKNQAGLAFRAMQRLKRNSTFAVTGTPIENRLPELWSIFDTILPGYLGNSIAFKMKFIVREQHDLLRTMIKPFILRRMKEEVVPELPVKVEKNIFVDLENEQKKLYESAVKEYKEQLMNNKDIGTIEILSFITELRKICSFPVLTDSGYSEISGKDKVLYELIEELIENNHRIIIFSQFTSGLKLLKRTLEKKYEILYLDGKTLLKARSALITKFNNGTGDIFLISLKTGGTGFNITGADTVIHYDPWWNPAVESQATGRAHRIGQNKKVSVYNLIAKETIEEYIFQLKERKRILTNDILSGLNFELSRDELIRFFRK